MLRNTILTMLFLTATTTATTPNDECITATPVNIASSQVYIGDANTAYMSEDDPTEVQYKLWYSFTPSVNVDVNITVCNTNPSPCVSTFIDVYQGSCGIRTRLIEKGTINECLTMSPISVSAGTSYLYYIYFSDGGASTDGTCNITHTSQSAPTKAPTNAPTNAPLKTPTNEPTNAPLKTPTNEPTNAPLKSPSRSPTRAPTMKGTGMPITPSVSPSQPPISSADECGLFGFSFFCPSRNKCGFWKRIFGIGDC